MGFDAEKTNTRLKHGWNRMETRDGKEEYW